MAEEIKDTVEETAEAAPEEKKTKKSKGDKKLENEIEALKKQLEEKETELAEQKEQHLRLAAEYDNFRRRSKAEREGVYSEACSDVVNEFLPVLDNIERAAAYATDEKVAEGINMMVKAFTESLGKLGVEEIECKVFDPNVHNAVMHIDDEQYGEGEIVEVFQKGFKRGDKVIRYAMVKTAN
ncbi:MAG: nucleotide exchange factor GrpE [Clostridia bacterium]|nr:nucleotide exchange factor GrpE [Clostridia bacterium]